MRKVQLLVLELEVAGMYLFLLRCLLPSTSLQYIYSKMEPQILISNYNIANIMASEKSNSASPFSKVTSLHIPLTFAPEIHLPKKGKVPTGKEILQVSVAIVFPVTLATIACMWAHHYHEAKVLFS